MHKEELYEMLCDELDQIAAKGELTAGSLDTIDKLTHSIKSLGTIMAMEGYSNEGRYEGSYERGRSNRGRNNRNRGSYARRGRYSREQGYSMDDQKEYIVEQLEDIMEEAEDGKTRKAIEKAIMQMG